MTTEPNKHAPVLIFGAPRSGTSLLSRLIDAHPDIAIPFESHLFNQWQPRLPAYGDLTDTANRYQLVRDILDFGVVRDWTPRPDPEEVMALTGNADFGAVARAFPDWWARKHEKPRWGEKTPHHTLLHRDVLTAWPDALAVIIQRDPRDVALSWKQARFGGNHVLPFARAWVRYAEAVAEIKETLPPERQVTLTYEELVQNPEAVLTRIMEFLGAPYDPVQLAFHQGSDEWHTDSRNAAKLRQPISPDSVGRWRAGLSGAEVRLIEHIAGDWMDRLDYVREATSPPSGAELNLARWVGYPVQRVLGLAKNTRGFVYLGRDLAWRAHQMRARLLGRKEAK